MMVYYYSPGCTDPYAENGNADANVDDGSCAGYPVNGNYSLNFDGVDDWVEIPNSASLDVDGNELSIIVTAKVNGDPSLNGGNCSHTSLISKTNNQLPYGGYGIISNESQSKWNFALGSGNYSSWNEISANNTFETNEFETLAGTFNGNSGIGKFYIDGELNNEQFLFNGPINSVPDNINIGKNPQQNNFCYFNGSINELIVLNKELNESEISGYIESISENQNNILAHYKFNSGSGEILYDHSGNQNHGTIVGATWEEVVSGCTDPYAENYNAGANMDDGSCTYPDNGNYSLSFDGVDDMIQIPDNDLYDFVNGFSVGFKFKPSLEFEQWLVGNQRWDGHGQTNRMWRICGNYHYT